MHPPHDHSGPPRLTRTGPFYMVPYMEKTTVYLDPADHRRLKALARQEGRSTAELIREAVAEYARRRAGGLRPASLGAGRSGRRDLSERAEELLEGMGGEE
jgi:hypothetical protein